ncbi:glycerophosphodiester phosphodiesterase [Methanoculleus sp. FWC-SCC1]|uniref:Glycerophosphodiester phosphodiesterase n=1 Tax=Methanoculleus frigidifontis TaxID=2584085 RepID=A0ABT8M8L4_9EURY|nr:glycerophosphodiester phosphodiesterase family protein [Methanoculleus sp. FWC-SCC1]MDN7024278.1 glycerophosphodiester phosphodiesterase [Methanoculleus sp. FWC-SCC1]
MFIVGHRGARARAPENTLAALRTGMACADYVEIDVRLTRDGIPVVIHDATVDRTTNGTGRVRDLALDDLRSLDAGEGEKIPTLREVLSLVDGRSGLIVEIKEQGTEEIVCSTLLENLPERCMLVSFHAGSVAAAKKLLPGAGAGLIFSEEQGDPVRDAADLGADAVLPRFDRLDGGLVRTAHERGLLVIPWVLNSVEDIHRAESLGVDGFASDDPCMARDATRG